MASHEALRHEPAVRRPEHVRDPYPLGVQDARQPVEERRRGRHVGIVWRDDPIAILEGRDAREATLPTIAPPGKSRSPSPPSPLAM